MKNTPFDSIARALKGIAHADRLRIVAVLGGAGEMSVGEVQKKTGLSQSMTSQHLIDMRQRGILKSRKVSNKVYYSVAHPQILKIFKCMDRCGKT